MRGITILLLVLGVLACRRASDDRPASSQASPSGASTGSAPTRAQQVVPSFDVKTPPADATKTASGLIYKKVVAKDAGAQPKRNDTVLIHYTSWRQNTGEAFFTSLGTKPMPLNLAQSAPAFTEALQLLRKGEKAMLWVPPSIGYKTPPTETAPETLVYEVEVVDIEPAPQVPDNYAKAPDNARTLRSGTKLVVLRPGSADKPRPFDNVTFHYTAWDPEGRMVDSTETRKSPVTAPPYKQPAAFAEMLTAMSSGQRARFWVDAAKVARDGKPVGGVERGLLCYEVEIVRVTKPAHDPPPVPPDVAKPPASAKRSPKGVSYRVIKSGSSNEHPIPSGMVKVNYTGWTTDGQMFDTSALTGKPAQFSLTSVIAGWTDVIPLMAVGDRWLIWVPEELAYKGAPGKPQGMLVFDVELTALVQPSVH